MSQLQPPLVTPPMVRTGQLVTPPTMSLTDATFQVARSCLNAAAEPNIRQLQQPVLCQACAASGGSGFLQLPEKLELQLQLQQLLHWRQNWQQQQQQQLLLLQQQPVGSRLSQQPVRPSTSTESTRKRKGTDSVPRTSKHTHPDPIPCRHRYGHLSLRLPIHPCLSAVHRDTVDACSRRKYLCCVSYSLRRRACALVHGHTCMRAHSKSST